MNFSYLPFAGLVVGVVFGLSFGLYGMYLQHRRRVLWHETARIALEKGQPIPEPSPDQPPWQWQYRQSGTPASANSADVVSSALRNHYRSHHRRGWMMGGLINVGVGVGLFVALSQVSKPFAYFAAIPFSMGMAVLLALAVECLFSRKSGQ